MPLFATVTPLPDYTLQRSRRRTVAIHVQDGRVEVRAPLRAAQRDIDAFVRQKTPWIMAKLAQLQVRNSEKLCIDDGSIIEMMGEPLCVRWQPAVRGHVQRCGEMLYIRGRALDEIRARKLLLRWLAEAAHEHLSARAEKCALDLGVADKLSGFTVRYTRSLWGRCSSRGNILFNPLILLAPVAVMDYLVAHEVCHLRHMNHSRQFWSLVASICPTWQSSRRWLKEHGHRLQVM